MVWLRIDPVFPPFSLLFFLLLLVLVVAAVADGPEADASNARRSAYEEKLIIKEVM
jgi:hypothetical protein